jgi:hypothetical protein
MPNSDALGMFIVAALLAIGGAADAQTGAAPGVKAEAKPGAVVVETVTFKAKVGAIDKDKRLITLTGPAGNTATVKAGPEVKNFDSIKTGDTLTVRYLESVALFVRKSDQPPAATEAAAVEVAPKGQNPAGMIVSTAEVNGTVAGVDVVKRTVTLKGSEGRTRTFRVDPSVKRLGELKKGDQVVARHTEALALSMSTP